MDRAELLEKYKEPIKIGISGSVALIDLMGDDACIASAARTSYAKGTKSVSDDRTLIRYLMRHQHFSPFSMAQLKLYLKLPIFVHNQWVRHDRFHWNVVSGRYSIMTDDKWSCSVDEFRGQGTNNKQVGDGDLPYTDRICASALLDLGNNQAQDSYNALLELGVCREQARTVLPLGQYTECFVTANLGDWLLFLKQRLADDAQLEIRQYSQVVWDIIQDWVPAIAEGFVDYQLEGAYFSKQELEYLTKVLNEHDDETWHREQLSTSKLSKREINEFLAKFS